MPLSNAERSRRKRDRAAGRLPACGPCAGGCGRSHYGMHGSLCNRCWQDLTEDGRADRAERVRRATRRKAGIVTASEPVG